MSRALILMVLILAFSVNTFSQQTDSLIIRDANKKAQHVYKIKPWIDLPGTAVMAALAQNGISTVDKRDTIPISVILNLSKNSINKFDRPIADHYSTKAKATSDLFFYGSMPLPLFLLLDKNIRKDGLRVGLLYLQALSITGMLYTTAAIVADRYRPYTYNPDVPIEIRQSGNSLNSFFAGHPSLVATSTFFMAKVYSDYHPNMKHKWILYTLAGTAAAATGYLRMRAGNHFTTDVITGVTMGAFVGVLVPHLHKNKAMSASKLTLLPNFGNGSTGFTAYYKFGK